MYFFAQWSFRVIYALLLARLIISWIRSSRNFEHPVVDLIERTSDPLVAPFRGLFPGRFDFSPVLTYFILSWIVQPLVLKVLGG